MGQLFVWKLKDLCEVIDQMVENKFDCIIFVEGNRGVGKCQKKGDKVLMSDGSWKNIEDIKVGDEIISPQKDGSFVYSKVIETHQHFDNNVYDIKEITRDGKLLYSCSGNHEIPILRLSHPRVKENGIYKGKRGSKQVLDLFSSDRISKSYCKSSHICSFTTTPIEFSNKKDCEIEPYSLGVFLGDGSFRSVRVKNKYYKGEEISKVNSHIRIYDGNEVYVKEFNRNKRYSKYKGFNLCRGLNITSADFEIIEEISKYYPISKIYLKKNKNGKLSQAKQYKFSLNGEFSKLLSKYGLEGKGSGDKFIPKDALTSSINYRKRLLAGLIDTDGTVSKNEGNHISITTKSNKMVEDIKNLVFSLGGYSNIKRIKKKCQNGFIGDYFYVSISFKNPNTIPLIVKSKKERLGNIMKHDPRHIAIQCIKTTPQQVYGFEINSPSKWYITNNYMITHNSTICYKLSSRLKNTVKFNPERDIHFSRKSILRAIATKQRRVVFGDELINVGFNRDFYIEEQKQLIKALNMYRDSCNVFIGCIPKFVTLDKQLQGLCKIRLTVLERGIALIQTQVPSIYTNDPWDIQNNQKIEAKWTLKGTKNPRYSQLTTVRGILRFKDLNPIRRERYEKIKHEKRNKIFMQENELGIDIDLNKIFYQNLIEQLKTGTLNKQEFEKICLVSGKKAGSVRARLSQLLNQQGISGGVTRLLAGEKEEEEEVNPIFDKEVS